MIHAQRGVLHYHQSRDGQEWTYYSGREREFVGSGSGRLSAVA